MRPMSKPFVPEKSTTKPPALTSSTRFAKGRALLLRGALLFSARSSQMKLNLVGSD